VQTKIFSSILFVGLLGICAGADARSSGGHGGRTINSGDSSCIVWDNHGVRNSCSRDVLFEVPLVIDTFPNGGVKSVGITGYGTSASQCIAMSTDGQGTVLWQTNWVSFTSSSSTIPTAVGFSLGNLGTTGASRAFVQCWLSTNAVLRGLSWTP
jgi:hypothetical protein